MEWISWAGFYATIGGISYYFEAQKPIWRDCSRTFFCRISQIETTFPYNKLQWYSKCIPSGAIDFFFNRVFVQKRTIKSQRKRCRKNTGWSAQKFWFNYSIDGRFLVFIIFSGKFYSTEYTIDFDHYWKGVLLANKLNENSSILNFSSSSIASWRIYCWLYLASCNSIHSTYDWLPLTWMS